MHELDMGWKHPYNKEEMSRMFTNYTKNTFKCRCGHSVFIENRERKKICSHCGNYVFINKKDEFKYKLGGLK